MRNLRGITRYGILYSYGTCKLIGFVDSNYGRDLDQTRSTIVDVFTLGGEAIT